MTHTSTPPPAARATRWLAWILAASLACSLLVFAGFRIAGDSPKQARERTVWQVSAWFFGKEYHDDSWGPMTRAYLRAKSREDGDIYGIFFDEGRKFQYPPTSLLPFCLVPEKKLRDNVAFYQTITRLRSGAKFVARTASQLAVLATIAASIALLEIGIRRLGAAGDTRGSQVARIVMLTLLGFTFYPVMKAHALGQIQVFLNALTAFSVLAMASGRRAACGFLTGMCCLIKPQLGVVLIWSALRRDWRLFGGFLAATVPMGLISLAVFGWQNHLRYLDVIRHIAKLGESFWPNQSVNGLLNRMLENGDAVNFSLFSFAPHHPLVHAATLASSLLILVLAMVRKNRTLNPELDLAVIVAAATMASPVAWEHHYGAFLPLFAVALPACLAQGKNAALTGMMLAVSYLLIAVAVLAPEIMFNPPSRGWMASHLFFGAVMFYGLLLYLRARPASTTHAPREA